MKIPKNSEIFDGNKFVDIITVEADSYDMPDCATIKYNTITIMKDGQIRPKSLERAMLRDSNTIAQVNRLTKHAINGNISEKKYFDALWHILQGVR